MALSTKIDYFDLATENMVLAGSSSKAPAYAVQATAPDECGDVVDRTHTGDQGTVESNYRLKAAESLAAILGEIETESGTTSVLTGLVISTAAGQAPTIQATGEILPGAATEVAKITVESISMLARHCAQNLLSAVTLSGDAKLTELTLTVACNFARTLVDGTTVSHDLSGGTITVSATAVSVLGTGTLAAGSGFTENAPASKTEEEDGYYTLAIEVVKDLASVAAGGGGGG